MSQSVRKVCPARLYSCSLVRHWYTTVLNRCIGREHGGDGEHRVRWHQRERLATLSAVNPQAHDIGTYHQAPLATACRTIHISCGSRWGQTLTKLSDIAIGWHSWGEVAFHL
jgi:hypothetical protein